MDQGIQLVRLDEYEERNQEIDNNINNFSTQLAHIAVDPYKFGAIGDFVNDDTQAVKNAIDFALTTVQNSINIINPYAIGYKLELPPGRFKITDTIEITSPLTLNPSVGRGFQVIIEGKGQTTSLEMTVPNKSLIKAYNVSVIFRDIALWAIEENGIPLELGKDDPLSTLEVRQAQFVNVFIRGHKNSIKINRVFDSYFENCFLAFNGQNGNGVDVIETIHDNTNNLNFVRCHFENSGKNGAFIKARGSNKTASSYHHGFNFEGCHFETRNYSTKILDLKYVESLKFTRCQFTQNINGNDPSDNINNAVEMFLFENVKSTTFDTVTIIRSGDQPHLPKLIKLVGYVNPLSIKDSFAPTCGTKTGGIDNLIDMTLCTTKRAIRLENSLLTSATNKSSSTDRLIVSDRTRNNRDWQIFNDEQRLFFSHTIDPSKDLLTKTDAIVGLSGGGQLMAKEGFTGLNVTIPSASVYEFTIPSNVSLNARGLLLFNCDDALANSYGLVSVSTNLIVPVFVGTNVVIGGDNTEPSNELNKLLVWIDGNKLKFKSTYTTNKRLMITPFLFGDIFN